VIASETAIDNELQVILDSAEWLRPKANHSPSESPQLLVLSANTRDSLREHVKNFQGYLQKHPERLSDTVYTAGQHREHLPHRTFSIATSGVLGEFAPFSKTSAKSPEIVMIFTGQGAQWPQMGRDLIETNPDFREDIVAMDDLLQALDYPPSWSIQGRRHTC
jgi:acyl transferase domain-containing protein